MESYKQCKRYQPNLILGAYIVRSKLITFIHVTFVQFLFFLVPRAYCYGVISVEVGSPSETHMKILSQLLRLHKDLNCACPQIPTNYLGMPPSNKNPKLKGHLRV